MDLTQAKAKYATATGQFAELKDHLKMMGGPQFLGFVTGPIYAAMKARSELVRDVSAAKAQAVIEREALRLLHLEGPQREEARRFLADNPAAYLRNLTKQVMTEVHALPVADQLSRIIDEL